MSQGSLQRVECKGRGSQVVFAERPEGELHEAAVPDGGAGGDLS